MQQTTWVSEGEGRVEYSAYVITERLPCAREPRDSRTVLRAPLRFALPNGVCVDSALLVSRLFGWVKLSAFPVHNCKNHNVKDAKATALCMASDSLIVA